MKKPNHFFVAISLLLATTAAASTCNTVAGVETTCKTASKSNPSIDHAFCVSAFRNVPNAPSLDLQGLASAAVALALANAESAEAKLDDLMDIEHDHAVKERYHDCFDAYDDVTSQLKDALDAVNLRVYRKAGRMLRSMPAAYARCTKTFHGLNGVMSPLGEMDGEYEKLAKIALAIVSMID